MESNEAIIKKKKRIDWNVKKTIAYIVIVVIILLSLPTKVKCATGDTVSSAILVIIFILFTCAGIGWIAKRNEAQ